MASFGQTRTQYILPTFTFGKPTATTKATTPTTNWLFKPQQPTTPTNWLFNTQQPTTTPPPLQQPEGPYFQTPKQPTMTPFIFGASTSTPFTTTSSSSTTTTPFKFGKTSSSTPFTFGTTSLSSSTPFTFGTKTTTTLAPVTIGTTQTTPAPGPLTTTSSTPMFTPPPATVVCPQPPTLIALNLPKNKMEGLIYMVCLDQKQTFENIKHMFDNVFNINVKYSIENLWFTSLIKYSGENFILNKVESQHVAFANLYSSLLRELMVENIQNPEQLYTWLINFAKKEKNKKMLWLFTILKNSGTTNFDDIIDPTNGLEVFALSLQTFIQYDNDPTLATQKALLSTNVLYKTFLLSLIGASYGPYCVYGSCDFSQIKPELTNPELASLVSKFI